MTKSVLPSLRYLAAIASIYGGVAIVVAIAAMSGVLIYFHPALLLLFLLGVATGTFSSRIVAKLKDMRLAITRAMLAAHRAV